MSLIDGIVALIVGGAALLLTCILFDLGYFQGIKVSLDLILRGMLSRTMDWLWYRIIIKVFHEQSNESWDAAYDAGYELGSARAHNFGYKLGFAAAKIEQEIQNEPAVVGFTLNPKDIAAHSQSISSILHESGQFPEVTVTDSDEPEWIAPDGLD